MNISKCYAAFGGDYNDVVKRIPSEDLIEKFLVKFLDDGSFSQLCTSMEEDDSIRAFSDAHTLKGVSANLGLRRLYDATDVLTEILRDEKESIPEGAFEAFEKVRTEYSKVVDTIREFI